jgi:drug/metabolite transporter (DMT)-like permease
MALGPLFTALGARFFLGHRLPGRTWSAIVVAGIGIAWMYGREVGGAGPQHLLGTAVALCVPIAAATNWTLMQHLHHTADDTGDMLPAVLVGAVLSALVTLPLALPLTASPHDLGLLGLLGVVQLAIPCLVAMTVSRVLKAPEISLLALLEVVFRRAVGPGWGAGEAPSLPVLGRRRPGAGRPGLQRTDGPAPAPAAGKSAAPGLMLPRPRDIPVPGACAVP